jgi:hypothetical protein
MPWAPPVTMATLPPRSILFMIPPIDFAQFSALRR